MKIPYQFLEIQDFSFIKNLKDKWRQMREKRGWSECDSCGYGIKGQFKIKNKCENCIKNHE